jgi:YidC/Oxa1 family membrane protein insertase
LLLAIYAGSQIASTYFMGATMDKTQRRIMMFLPIIFITFVAQFPMGLILYWMTTNLWTVGQGLITRKLVPKPNVAAAAAAPAGPKRSSRTPPKEEPGAVAETPKQPPAPPQTRRVKKKKKGGARR